MRIAQISDTHIGITTEGQLKAMLKRLQQDPKGFDVLVHCGDYGGTWEGAPCVKRTVRLMRKAFPDKPIVSTIGNHDYWCKSSKRKRVEYWDGSVKYVKQAPGPDDFYANLGVIAATFKEAGIHYLDKDGPYTHPDFLGITLLGASGWYTNLNPSTRDAQCMPIGMHGNTHQFILKSTEGDLRRSEDQLGPWGPGRQLVFVSHFPVVNTGNDYKGAFESFSWGEFWSKYFIQEYGCRHFLCGHAHQLHYGPLRYECGPDYYRPAYQIIEIPTSTI